MPFNYDLLLERATGLQAISYEQPDAAVEMFISLVCASEGLGEDTIRDAELYEIYRQKFERLRQTSGQGKYLTHPDREYSGAI